MTPTQGTWKAQHGRVIIGGQVMPVIAPDGAPLAEIEANSHVIAAAKNLQTMLMRLMDEVMLDESVFTKIAPLTLEHARAAISKSKGD
ncbi:hypothetical protein UFOVP275_53 [uncultured Caudovirales phage]|uniref:Uncharacterized protein n=1 Tax=uncultured Caudovirales phage TaxID=2100421 RepID=A0A6J5LQ39_9CAUD|nr:hypothetical protein UFOVP275_53 [uncultured Caudovirales phage]